MKNIVRRTLWSVIIIFFGLIIYTIWDNNRIKIVKEDIFINNLATQFDNFTILQISDLHEKQFGKNQKKLIKIINSIPYDVLIFTGDMMTSPESTDYTSFYQLLDGITDRENILFVPGNTDPPSYQITPEFGKSEFVSGMEERGVRLLESFETIDVLGESIHFVNFELSIINNPEKIGNINGMFRPFHASHDEYQVYQAELWEEMMDKGILISEDTIIALNHAPAPDFRINYIKKDPNTVWRDYDLIIAGHYHGGQIRLPFIGALYIPDPWYKRNSFFPPQDRVKGLWEFEQTKQYVSAGLGSSDAIPFLKFRLFNPPEINLLKLKQK